MTETEEIGHFEHGVWIPQPKPVVVLQETFFQQPTIENNIWMIMVRLEKIESHLFRLEQLLNTIDSELRWRK